MVESAKRLILGVAHSPGVVAAARGLVLYGAPIAVTLLVGYLNTITDPRYYGLALAAVPLVRALGEGLLDQLNKASQNAISPLPPAGASPGTAGDAVRGID